MKKKKSTAYSAKYTHVVTNLNITLFAESTRPRSVPRQRQDDEHEPAHPGQRHQLSLFQGKSYYHSHYISYQLSFFQDKLFGQFSLLQSKPYFHSSYVKVNFTSSPHFKVNLITTLLIAK